MHVASVQCVCAPVGVRLATTPLTRHLSLPQISSLALANFSSSWHVPHACGQRASIDAGFFSHSPLAAQSGHAVSLSVQTVAQTPHVLAQSRITAPGFAAHLQVWLHAVGGYMCLHGGGGGSIAWSRAYSASPQISHWVAFLSSQTVAWQTSHAAGHVFKVKPGFEWHCPAEAHPGQSLCVSLHSSRQTPHETGQCFSIKLGLSPHAPAAVHPAQSACTSLHVGVHSPHDVGQALSMKSAFLAQSPAFAQEAQETSVSSQVRVHVAHESGQSTAKYSELLPVHSPVEERGEARG